MKPKLPASPRRAVTRADLVAAVYEQLGVSKQEAKRLVDATLNEIADALLRGEDAKFASFGSFAVRAKSARVGRNPKTGVEAPIAARRVLRFKASMGLRDHVSGRTACSQTGMREIEGQRREELT